MVDLLLISMSFVIEPSLLRVPARMCTVFQRLNDPHEVAAGTGWQRLQRHGKHKSRRVRITARAAGLRLWCP
jgi:hypothetical protein